MRTIRDRIIPQLYDFFFQCVLYAHAWVHLRIKNQTPRQPICDERCKKQFDQLKIIQILKDFISSRLSFMCSDFRYFCLFEVIWYQTEGDCLKSKHVWISDVYCIRKAFRKVLAAHACTKSRVQSPFRKNKFPKIENAF